jgi:L-cysteate sulfo-lyase
MEEFLQQGVDADWILFGTSSGGTHAGLVLGQRVFGYRGKVLGISIDEPEEWLKARVSSLASDASEKLGSGSSSGALTFSPTKNIARLAMVC